MSSSSPARRRHPRSRTARITRAVLVSITGIILLAAVGLGACATTGVMPAEPRALAAVAGDPSVKLTEMAGMIIMTPSGQTSQVGLVFIPGANVDAAAYLYKLAEAVRQDGLAVVVTRPLLNLAFFDRRPLSAFTGNVPGITTWYVGGHSLGGVRACHYARQPEIAGLILFASYCANDLSHLDLRVLSFSGSEDTLSTPVKITESAGILPASATFVQINGANHASFGDYGEQRSDGQATASDASVRSIITDQITLLLSGK